jgi:hypothetical protein
MGSTGSQEQNPPRRHRDTEEARPGGGRQKQKQKRRPQEDAKIAKEKGRDPKAAPFVFSIYIQNIKARGATMPKGETLFRLVAAD